MKYWSKLTNSVYAQLMERLEAERGLPSSGTVVQVEVKKDLYNQHRVSFYGKRVSFYIGKDDPEMKERLKCRRELCSILIVNGCNMLDRVSASAIELLDAAGCFHNQNAVLVGSHAFGIIGNMLGVTWQNDIVETEDIDLGRFIKLGGIETIDLSGSLQRAGFRDVPGFSHKDPPTSYKHDKSGMKIDFLTPLTGRPIGNPAKLTGMEVYAERLRFFDYLITDPVHGAAMTKHGILVQVPQPARYAFHKCIVATRRDASKEAKRKKDIQQAESLFEVLLEFRTHDLEQAWDALDWKNHARQGMKMLSPEIQEEVENIIRNR